MTKNKTQTSEENHSNNDNASQTLRKMLGTHMASEINSSSKTGYRVIEFDDNTKIIDAANVLFKHNILGAPVWSTAEKRYIGFFDMRDILSTVTASGRAFQEEFGKETGPGDAERRRGSLIKRYNAIMVETLETMTNDKERGVHPTISYLAARNPFHSCVPNSTLADVSRVLLKFRCHRVPIVENGRCTGIISQSALVKFLSVNLNMAELQKETLQNANFDYHKDVVSIKDTASAFDAFELLDSTRLSGIAIVDEDGKLVGNTSARDIKTAAIDEGKTAMDQDILSYLASVRQAELEKNDRYPSCHLHEDATIGHVLNLLAKTGYHRLFVVDSETRPVGVISVADVIRFAFRHEDTPSAE